MVKLESLGLDEWQLDVVNETEKNICLRSGRQVGKSHAISIKAAEFAVKNSKKTILVIASVERQAYLLFEKVLSYIETHYSSYLKKGRDRPTKSRMKLKNGSVIYCLPTGLTGHGIRGYTIDLLIADEAAFINEEVWAAVTPMLAVTKGKIILLSTPHGKEGYFYRCFSDPSFRSFHVSSEDCQRISKDFLAREKERMSKLHYYQEYLGEFISDIRQLFPDSLIKRQMKAKPYSVVPKNKKFFLGVDVAGMGEDPSAFEIVEEWKGRFIHRQHMITRKRYVTETTNTVIALDNIYSFTRIFIDDGGIGFGVFDWLLHHDQTGRRVEAVNNSTRALNRSGDFRKTLMKEELYNSLLNLMEKDKIDLLEDEEVFLSLKSVQFEYTDDGRMKIFGNDTHIAEALIRAVKPAIEKRLNIYVF